MVICYALYPLHQRLLRATGQGKTLSALLMCATVMVGLILPILSFSLLIGGELTRTYTIVAELVKRGEGFLYDQRRDNPFVAVTVTRLQEYERLTAETLDRSLPTT